MNVQTMTMTTEQAHRALRQYRDRRRKKLEPEFDEIEQAYAQLAKGTPLLDVGAAITSAPRDAKGRPMLAIARADQRQVRYAGEAWQESFNTRWREWRSRTADAVCVFSRPAYHDGPRVEGYSLVPLVPPVQAQGHDLSKHFVFWEVEAWADQPQRAPGDRDPYLLKRISPLLYAVVEEWELTDVERAVMRSHRVV